MYRIICVTLIGLLFLTGSALAAAGHRGDVTIDVVMNMSMLGEMPDDEAGQFPGMDPMQFTGAMYWTDDAMRMELEMGMLGGNMVTLVDYQKMVAYQLDIEAGTAIKIDLQQQMDEMKELGMPMMQPDQMFTNWEDTLQAMKDMPGVAIEELGTESVNGSPCQKIKFTMDMSEAIPDSDTAAEPPVSMGSMEGMYWIDADLNMPIKMNVNFMGSEITWMLSNVAEWTADPSMLSVPVDYTITTYDEMMEQMMSEMNASAPAAAE